MRAALPLAMVIAIAAPAVGDHCGAWATDDPDLMVYALGTVVYVDNDLCQPTCLWSAWVYQESNGMPGMQRDDPMMDLTCHGTIAGDTILVGALDGDVRSGVLV